MTEIAHWIADSMMALPPFAVGVLAADWAAGRARFGMDRAADVLKRALLQDGLAGQAAGLPVAIAALFLYGRCPTGRPPRGSGPPPGCPPPGCPQAGCPQAGCPQAGRQEPNLSGVQFQPKQEDV